MKWGHKIASKGGPIDVTRAEFNESFGAQVPDAPVVSLEYVLSWFWHLSNRRAPGFDGVAPISYTEIGSWTALTRTIVTPSEIELLVAMDNAYLEQIGIERTAKRERDAPPTGTKKR
jgi:hypothetical protein